MRDEKDKIEQLDGFSDYMRRRLDEYPSPVDEGGWEALEARMNKKPHAAKGWWWYAGSLVAAAVMALVVWLMPVPEEMPVNESLLSREKLMDRPEETSSPSEQVEVVRETVAPARSIIARVMVDMPILLEDIPDVTLGKDVEIELRPQEIPVGRETRKSDLSIPVPEEYRKSRIERPGKKRRKDHERRKWQLAASVGTGGYVSSLMGDGLNDMQDDPTFENPGIDSKPEEDEKDKDKNGNQINGGGTNLRSASLRSATDDLPKLDRSFESYPDVRYSMPISFGFTVRKNLNKHIGVESGLVYTYLSTAFRQFGMCRTEVKSRLHYLGIPVNLVVNLWDRPRWNIYLSGGVMMEKGIQAVYSEQKIWIDRIDNCSAKEGIDGLQWSMNVSVGAAYRMYRDWSLYLEPRFSYYFDSDQPVSIRTDKPLGFGLNAGVRFEF